jgi:hypothetical protein
VQLRLHRDDLDDRQDVAEQGDRAVEVPIVEGDEFACPVALRDN